MSTSMLFSSPERACGLTRVNIESPFVKVNLDSPSERERIGLLSDYTPMSHPSQLSCSSLIWAPAHQTNVTTAPQAAARISHLESIASACSTFWCWRQS